MHTLQADRCGVFQDSVLILSRVTFLRHVREGPTLYLIQAQRIIQIITSISLGTILLMYILL
jgi:hypothetical protein